MVVWWNWICSYIFRNNIISLWWEYKWVFECLDNLSLVFYMLVVHVFRGTAKYLWSFPSQCGQRPRAAAFIRRIFGSIISDILVIFLLTYLFQFEVRQTSVRPFLSDVYLVKRTDKRINIELGSPLLIVGDVKIEFHQKIKLDILNLSGRWAGSRASILLFTQNLFALEGTVYTTLHCTKDQSLNWKIILSAPVVFDCIFCYFLPPYSVCCSVSFPILLRPVAESGANMVGCDRPRLWFSAATLGCERLGGTRAACRRCWCVAGAGRLCCRAGHSPRLLASLAHRALTRANSLSRIKNGIKWALACILIFVKRKNIRNIYYWNPETLHNEIRSTEQNLNSRHMLSLYSWE